MSKTARQRVTKQREFILQMIEGNRTHPTVEDLYQQVKKQLPKISLATVYRNLEELAREGKIQKLDGCGNQRRFDSTTEDHYHVRCTKCGRVDDIDLDPSHVLLSKAGNASEYEITGYQLLFRGVCPGCKKK